MAGLLLGFQQYTARSTHGAPSNLSAAQSYTESRVIPLIILRNATAYSDIYLATAYSDIYLALDGTRMIYIPGPAKY